MKDERLRRSRRSGPIGDGRSPLIAQAKQGRENPRVAGFARDAAAEARRFFAKTARAENGCLQWTGATRDGYGLFRVWRDGRWILMQAHRWAWEERHGPIRGGLYPDHTCHNEDLSCPPGPACLHRACQDTGHMELVTDEENRRRARVRNAARKGIA